MSMIALAMLAAINVVAPQNGPNVFSTENARNLQIAGERPRLVVISRSGSPGFERGIAVAASLSIQRSADGLTLTPSWSAVSVDWTGELLKSSKVVNQLDCPILTEAISSLERLSEVDPNLPTATYQRPEGAIPPPDFRLHESYTVWMRSSGRGGLVPDSSIEYEAIGGPVAVLARDFVERLTPCWAD